MKLNWTHRNFTCGEGEAWIYYFGYLRLDIIRDEEDIISLLIDINGCQDKDYGPFNCFEQAEKKAIQILKREISKMKKQIQKLEKTLG